MDFLDLPDELIIEIVKVCDYKEFINTITITSMTMVCKRLSKLLKKRNILCATSETISEYFYNKKILDWYIECNWKVDIGLVWKCAIKLDNREILNAIICEQFNHNVLTVYYQEIHTNMVLDIEVEYICKYASLPVIKQYCNKLDFSDDILLHSLIKRKDALEILSNTASLGYDIIDKDKIWIDTLIRFNKTAVALDIMSYAHDVFSAIYYNAKSILYEWYFKCSNIWEHVFHTPNKDISFIKIVNKYSPLTDVDIDYIVVMFSKYHHAHNYNLYLYMIELKGEEWIRDRFNSIELDFDV